MTSNAICHHRRSGGDRADRGIDRCPGPLQDRPRRTGPHRLRPRQRRRRRAGAGPRTRRLVARGPGGSSRDLPSARAAGRGRVAARHGHPGNMRGHRDDEGRRGCLVRDGGTARRGSLSLQLQRRRRVGDRPAQPVNQRIEQQRVEPGGRARVRRVRHEARAARRGGVGDYYSTALGRFRRMHVYTPPGYEIGSRNFRCSICCTAPATRTIRGRQSAARASSSTT